MASIDDQNETSATHLGLLEQYGFIVNQILDINSDSSSLGSIPVQSYFDEGSSSDSNYGILTETNDFFQMTEYLQLQRVDMTAGTQSGPGPDDLGQSEMVAATICNSGTGDPLDSVVSTLKPDTDQFQVNFEVEQKPLIGLPATSTLTLTPPKPVTSSKTGRSPRASASTDQKRKAKSTGKVWKYEMDGPEFTNAKMAKANRERKKLEKEEICNENSRLKLENERMEQELMFAEASIARLRSELEEWKQKNIML